MDDLGQNAFSQVCVTDGGECYDFKIKRFHDLKIKHATFLTLCINISTKNMFILI